MRYVDCVTEEDIRRFRAQELRREKNDRLLPKRLGIAVAVYVTAWGCIGLYARAHSNLLPDFSVTPGAVRTVDKADVCWQSTRQYRHWSRARDDRILKEYGLPAGPHPDHEIDHLIPLDLGGTDEDANLWPEKRRSIEPMWNAERKDRLERELADLVCDGTVSLVEAQGAIQKDWIEAYRKYIGALDETIDDQLGTP